MSESFQIDEEVAPLKKFDLASLNWPLFNWPLIEVYFLRTLACVFLIRGLYDWGVIIGFFEGRGFLPAGQNYFENLNLNMQVLVGFSAIFALISGVGLWTLNAWGNAVWLFLCIVLLVVDIIGILSANPDVHQLCRPIIRIVFDFALILIYFIITTQALLSSERIIRS